MASAALATVALMASALVVRVVPGWPPHFVPRLDVIATPDAPWGAPWDAMTTPAIEFPRAALAALTRTVASLGAGALLVAILSLMLHAVSRLLAQWQGLTIRCALGAQMSDLVRAVGYEISVLGFRGTVFGVVLGGILAAGLTATWPALLTTPGVIGSITIAAAAAALLVQLVLAAVTLPILVHLQRRVRAVADLTGTHATLRGPLLRAQSALVVLQLAGLLIVAYGGALMVRGSSLFDPHRPVPYDDSSAVAPLAFSPASTVPARAAAYRALLAAARHGDTPLVAITSPNAWLGMGQNLPVFDICMECYGAYGLSPINGSRVRAIAASPGALTLMGVRIQRRGRDFLPSDTAGAEPVAILSRAAAATLFPRARALGKTVQMGFTPDVTYRVIGIADVVAPEGLGAPPLNSQMMYLSLLQHPPVFAEVTARAGAWQVLESRGWPGLLSSLAPRTPHPEPALLADELRRAATPLAWFGALVAVLATLTLGVASYALAAVMHQVVILREREIALRLALGARRRHVFSWIGGKALALTVAGAAIGISLARWLGDVLRRHVAGAAPDDLYLLGVMVAGFAGLALVASWLPTRRALDVDPAAMWAKG